VSILKITHSIKSLEVEKIKIVFQFLLMLSASFICGICLLNIITQEAVNNAFLVICRHFTSPFEGSVSFFHKLRSYLTFCLSDILSVLLLFIFSFSFFNYFASDIVIIYQGFAFGVNASLLCCVGSAYVSIVHIFAYVLCRLLIIISLVVYAYKMSCYSLNIRKFSARGRITLSFKSFVNMFVSMIAVIGFILIVKGLYCLTILFFN